MNDNATPLENLASPGERLNHLLDDIGFKQGRGRVIEMQKYLVKQCPEVFSTLKYNTVKSWFSHSTPPMAKMTAMLEQLNKDYPFSQELPLIKAWWIVGEFNPFDKVSISQLSETYLHKLQYKVMALISEEAGDQFEELSVERLDLVKESATNFAHDFIDPEIDHCPEGYLRIIIHHYLKSQGSPLPPR